MSRPEKVEDLEEYDRMPREFVKLDLQHLTVDVSVGAAVLTLIEAARRSERFDVVEDAGMFVVTVPLSEGETDSRLRRAQGAWDSNRDGYDEARLDASSIATWRRFSIDQWAKREGLESIDWPVSEAEAVV